MRFITSITLTTPISTPALAPGLLELFETYPQLWVIGGTARAIALGAPFGDTLDLDLGYEVEGEEELLPPIEAHGDLQKIPNLDLDYYHGRDLNLNQVLWRPDSGLWVPSWWDPGQVWMVEEGQRTLARALLMGARYSLPVASPEWATPGEFDCWICLLKALRLGGQVAHNYSISLGFQNPREAWGKLYPKRWEWRAGGQPESYYLERL